MALWMCIYIYIYLCRCKKLAAGFSTGGNNGADFGYLLHCNHTIIIPILCAQHANNGTNTATSS